MIQICFFVALSAVFLQSTVYSATTSTRNTFRTATTQVLTASPAPQKSFELGLTGWSYTSFMNRLDGKQPKADGTPGSPTQIVNQWSISFPTTYRLAPTIVPQFALQPFEGSAFQVQNPTIGMQGVVYSNGGFAYWARYEAALPLTNDSRTKGLIIKPQSINVVTYRFNASGLLLKAVVIPGVNVYANGETDGSVYFSPSVNYIFNDNWMAVALVECGIERKKNVNWFAFNQDGNASAGLGLRYTWNNNFYIQPFVNTYPFTAVTNDNTHLGVFFGGTIL